jgi:hypothetical protein
VGKVETVFYYLWPSQSNSAVASKIGRATIHRPITPVQIQITKFTVLIT